VAALLERVRTDVYTREPGWPLALFALDEVANIAPLPTLPAIVSEGGSQGLVTIASLHDLSQARTRWDPTADGFLTLFGAKLVFPGLADHRTLQLLSSLAGEHDVPVRSHTEPTSVLWPGSGPSTTTSWRRQPALPVDEIARGYPGMALAIHAGEPPIWITLTPWWQDPWQGIARR
jgi:type IV secretory pathway TraG/TraD family ATPase VirD4